MLYITEKVVVSVVMTKARLAEATRATTKTASIGDGPEGIRAEALSDPLRASVKVHVADET